VTQRPQPDPQGRMKGERGPKGHSVPGSSGGGISMLSLDVCKERRGKDHGRSFKWKAPLCQSGKPTQTRKKKNQPHQRSKNGARHPPAGAKPMQFRKRARKQVTPRVPSPFQQGKKCHSSCVLQESNRRGESWTRTIGGEDHKGKEKARRRWHVFVVRAKKPPEKRKVRRPQWRT